MPYFPETLVQGLEEMIALLPSNSVFYVQNPVLTALWMKNLHHRCTTSQSQIDRIQRLFSFGDFLSFSYMILGTRLVLLLIEDLKYNRDEKIIIARSQTDKRAFMGVMYCICISETIKQRLEQKGFFSVPFYCNVYKLMSKFFYQSVVV